MIGFGISGVVQLLTLILKIDRIMMILLSNRFSENKKKKVCFNMIFPVRQPFELPKCRHLSKSYEIGCWRQLSLQQKSAIYFAEKNEAYNVNLVGHEFSPPQHAAVQKIMVKINLRSCIKTDKRKCLLFYLNKVIKLLSSNMSSLSTFMVEIKLRPFIGCTGNVLSN